MRWVVFPEGTTMVARAKIAQFAIAERPALMFGWNEHADAGRFMSYGASLCDVYVRLAAYAQKLLRGAKPRSCRPSSRRTSSWS